MANTIRLKRSSFAGKAPAIGDLQLGEIAINTTDGKLFLKKSDGGEFIVEVGPVTSVAGRTGTVALSKTDVGLSAIDNTSDLAKPISTAMQTALNGKASSLHAHAIADITSLQTSLDAKAALVHTHAISDISSLQTTLNAKAALVHSHSAADIVSGTVGIAYLPKATAAEFRASVTDRLLATDQVWAAAAEVTLADAATIAVDLSTFINAVVSLAGNRVLGQPTNIKVGQAGVIRIVQDATGSRTLGFHADWEFTGKLAPSLSLTAGANDLLFYQVLATGRVIANLLRDVG
jgi:hypothetical protein